VCSPDRLSGSDESRATSTKGGIPPRILERENRLKILPKSLPFALSLFVDVTARHLSCKVRTTPRSGASLAKIRGMPNLVGKFLRHIETHRWLTQDGRLSHDVGEAYRIGTTAAAIDLCRKLRLQGMELVLKFDDPVHDISVPIPFEEGKSDH
jgi:hypothetical protein